MKVKLSSVSNHFKSDIVNASIRRRPRIHCCVDEWTANCRLPWYNLCFPPGWTNWNWNRRRRSLPDIDRRSGHPPAGIPFHNAHMAHSVDPRRFKVKGMDWRMCAHVTDSGFRSKLKAAFLFFQWYVRTVLERLNPTQLTSRWPYFFLFFFLFFFYYLTFAWRSEWYLSYIPCMKKSGLSSSASCPVNRNVNGKECLPLVPVWKGRHLLFEA